MKTLSPALIAAFDQSLKASSVPLGMQLDYGEFLGHIWKNAGDDMRQRAKACNINRGTVAQWGRLGNW